VNRANVTPCSSNLANYPVLISLSGTYLRTVANGGRIRSASGHGIEFRAADGQARLDHEVESYNGTTGALVAWVRVPSLAYSGAGADSVLYMYYGNWGITTSQSNPAGVWDSNFVGVWHLRENPTGGAAHPGERRSARRGDVGRPRGCRWTPPRTSTTRRW
jgi:hypothetical protein